MGMGVRVVVLRPRVIPLLISLLDAAGCIEALNVDRRTLFRSGPWSRFVCSCCCRVCVGGGAHHCHRGPWKHKGDVRGAGVDLGDNGRGAVLPASAVRSSSAPPAFLSSL